MHFYWLSLLSSSTSPSVVQVWYYSLRLPSYCHNTCSNTSTTNVRIIFLYMVLLFPSIFLSAPQILMTTYLNLALWVCHMLAFFILFFHPSRKIYVSATLHHVVYLKYASYFFICGSSAFSKNALFYLPTIPFIVLNKILPIFYGKI